MASCDKCGKAPCECYVKDERELFEYPRDAETGEPRYVPEKAHYANCPHCHEDYDRNDPAQVRRHRHDRGK